MGTEIPMQAGADYHVMHVQSASVGVFQDELVEHRRLGHFALVPLALVQCAIIQRAILQGGKQLA